MSLIDEQIAVLDERRREHETMVAACKRREEFERTVTGFWRSLAFNGVHRLDGTDAVTSEQEAVLRDGFRRLTQAKAGWIVQGPDQAYLLPHRWNRKRLPADAVPARTVALHADIAAERVGQVTLDDRGRLWAPWPTGFKYLSAETLARQVAIALNHERR